MVRSLSKILLTAALLPAAAFAEYNLTKEYSGYDFVSGFDFYNGPDPTNGHVQYKGYATANATGLAGFLSGPNLTNVDDPTLPPPIYLGVDHTNVYPVNTGRPSVRVSSVQTFNHSLVVADIRHMPSSTCGLWPAFWMLGTSAGWPNAGEIDILENVNDNDFNIMTLHTNAGLTVINDTNLFNGTMKTSNCDIAAKDQDTNAGCSIKDKSDVNSYGTNFNNIGGGVFAIQYTSEQIAIWFFPRNAIPNDIKSHNPTPPSTSNTSLSTWGKPNALFQPPAGTSTSLSSTSASSLSSTSASTSTSTSSATPTGNTIIPVSEVVPMSTFASGTVSPSTSASASFNSNSNSNSTSTPSVFDSHFSSLQIIFDTTFCGDWAGKVWNSTSCGKLAPTCEEYVSANPRAFEDAFWAIQSVKVYEESLAPAEAGTGMPVG